MHNSESCTRLRRRSRRRLGRASRTRGGGGRTAADHLHARGSLRRNEHVSNAASRARAAHAARQTQPPRAPSRRRTTRRRNGSSRFLRMATLRTRTWRLWMAHEMQYSCFRYILGSTYAVARARPARQHAPTHAHPRAVRTVERARVTDIALSSLLDDVLHDHLRDGLVLRSATQHAHHGTVSVALHTNTHTCTRRPRSHTPPHDVPSACSGRSWSSGRCGRGRGRACSVRGCGASTSC
jgi:hypothetical protein